MKLTMKNSISAKLGLILASCLLIVLGSGLFLLLNQARQQSMKQTEENVRESKDILLKSISFAMSAGIDSAEPFARLFREVSSIRDVRVTPTAVIDETRQSTMDPHEKEVLQSQRSRFYSETYMDEEVIRVIEPLLAETTCLDCHDTKVGDPLAVVSIRYSLEETNAASRAETILGTLIVVICIVVTFVVMMFLIRKQIIVDLRRIIDALKKFAVGNVRDTITTSREDELGDAVKSLCILQDNLKSKSDVATEIAKGNLDIAVNILSDDDALGLSMQKMRDNIHASMTEIEKQNWLKSGVSALNDQMRGEQDLRTLSGNVISYLTKYSGAQIGAIYLNNDGDSFKLLGSYAFNNRKGNNNQVKPGQGLVGQAALEKQTIIFNDIPDDYIKINSGLGESVPRNIIVSPLVFDGEIKGVIEVGSAANFTNDQLEFFNQVSESIAIAINSSESRTKTQELLEKTQQQAEELQAQQEELRVTNEELQSQQEELRTTNEELQEQTKALQVSEAEMKAKQDDLIAANNALETQKKEIETKNADLEITRREVEEKAKQLELTSKYKSEFLANMSHELRTPMNSIQILSKLMADNKDGNLTKKQIEFARTINASGSDLLELINEILDLSKIESGKMTLNLGEMTFSNLAEYLTKNFEHVVAEKGLSLNVIQAGDIPKSIITDRQRVEQILKNLLSNAIKFTKKGGVTVEITNVLQTDVFENKNLDYKKAVKISVSDTGIGIPEDKQKLIFEAFQQADGTTSRKYGGTGLGLSISRELVKMLKGEIQLESEPGKGSKFTIFLPHSIGEDEIIETTAGTAADSESVPEEGPAAEAKKIVKTKVNQIPDDRNDLAADDETILVVDDDPRFASIMFDMVREKGFKCILAEDGEAGLQMANQYKPSAIILDVGLPRIDGWTVMKRLKQSRETRHIPVYFISVQDQRLDAMKMGAIGYLTKPVNQESLNTAFKKIRSTISRDIKKVLIVEDDKDMRTSMKELLRSEESEITSVDGGKKALKLLAKQEFDCMVLDLGLKDISGFDLLDSIKSNEKFRDLPIIIYTGREMDKEEEKNLRKHAESIIIKGAKSPDRLLDEVRLFLHQVETSLPKEKQRRAKIVHEKEGVFKDKKVMVVDDDIRNIFAIVCVLEEKEMQIVVAENGKEALTALEKNKDIDLVLMDIMMPEMDGYETMRQIRKKSEFAKLPIIALTAKAMKGDRQKCIDSGANDYLSKPIDVEKMLSLLHVWLYK